MAKNQHFYLYFTKDDEEVIAWANMIKKSGQSLNTWIQGILVADIAREELSIGSVFVPNLSSTQPQETQQRTTNLFGDDTKPSQSEKKAVGWNVRKENGQLKEGSILSIKVTRPIVINALAVARKRHKSLNTYTKALVRRSLKVLPSKPDQPPKQTDVFDLLAMAENKIQRKYPNDKRENSQQKRDQQQGSPQQKKKVSFKNKPERTIQESQKQQDSLTSITQQTQEKPMPAADKETKKRNPLLNYIT